MRPRHVTFVSKSQLMGNVEFTFVALASLLLVLGLILMGIGWLAGSLN